MGCGGAGVPELLYYEIRDLNAKCSIRGNVDVQQMVLKVGLPKGTFVVILFKPEKNLGKRSVVQLCSPPHLMAEKPIYQHITLSAKRRRG